MGSARFPNPLFVAIDTPDLDRALSLARAVAPHVGGLKLGLEFLTAQGPAGVRSIVALGLPVFADTKFHDIPNTVGGAAREIARLGVSIFNIHASGGEAMMRAAKEAAGSVDPKVKVIAVTVLTSLDEDALAAVGQNGPASDQAARLATLAQRTGLDGVVCSARDIPAIRRTCPAPFMLVTPGIRPEGSDPADQRRLMTPREASAAGADILVVGRPITAASDPAEAARLIAEGL